MKGKDEKSREEQLAGEVLALVERFHEPHGHDRHDEHEPRRAMRIALPAGIQAMLLLSLARQLRARRRRAERVHGPVDRMRRDVRHAFGLRHQ
jgi:hypothetical protein